MVEIWNRGDLSYYCEDLIIMTELNTGERLRLLRTRLNLTQGDVSKITGIHQKVISEHENGVSNPGSEKIQQYADCYGTTTDYLFCRTDDQSPPVKRDDPPGLAYFMERPHEYMMPDELPVSPQERILLRQIPGHLTPKGYAHILRIIRREVERESNQSETDTKQ